MLKDNTNSILTMEASFLQTRLKTWYSTNIGPDIKLFKAQSPDKQQELIQFLLRFTNSCLASAELIGELLNCTPTIKVLLVNTLRIIEYHRRSNQQVNNDPAANPLRPSLQDPNAFVAYMRRRFTASLNLFRCLSSPKYLCASPKESLQMPDFLAMLGPDSLYSWGEALLCYAECSLRLWKPQYISVVRMAEDMFVRCLQLDSEAHHVHFALGNVLLLLAKAEGVSSPSYISLLNRSKSAFLDACTRLPGVKGYNFNFIRACSLMGQEHELVNLLQSFVNSFPASCLSLLDEPDFDRFRSQTWFHEIVMNASNVNIGDASAAQPALTPPPLPSYPALPLPQLPVQPSLPPQHGPSFPPYEFPPDSVKPSLPPAPPKSPPASPSAAASPPPQPFLTEYMLMNSYPPPMEIPGFYYPDPSTYQPCPVVPAASSNEALERERVKQHEIEQQIERERKGLGDWGVVGRAGVGEAQYGYLQTSLLESGFSIKRLLEVFNWLPVSSGMVQAHPPEDSDHVKKQKLRLQQRLELYQLKPRREIPGDGNCQMHAMSDQLFDTIERSRDVRKQIVEWLRKNKDWKLPNESILHEFVHDKPWEEYCNMMAKDGCWGDHLTLLAASELFGVVISIISSVEGDNFITEIRPTVKKLDKVLLLSHYAEFHYGSLTHIGATLK